MQPLIADGLIPISPATLVADAWPGLDLYLRSTSDSKPVLYHSGDEAPVGSSFMQLSQSVGCKLYIDKSQRGIYQDYLRANWQDLVKDTDKPLVNRVGVMSDVMRDVLGAGFDSGDTNQIVTCSKDLASAACQVIGDSPIVMGQLLSVLHHDYGTFTHSTNVALYCVLLARELGISGPALEEIAVGGLIHDLGKLQIDEKILNKPGRLTEAEFRVVKEHPTVGYRQLCARKDLSFGQLMMVYQHHEKVNGSGYPVGCSADETHDWARI